MQKITVPELLAPAGNLEKLRWAVAYGADAVYLGLKQFSLRSFAGNFSYEEAQEAFRYLHARNKKGYVTLNIYPFDYEIALIIEAAQRLERAEKMATPDALIVADLGVFHALKKAGIKTPIHISTQANTTNAMAAVAWEELGAVRVNLARELSLQNIRDFQHNLNKINSKIETEAFIHGAVCFSMSGRCTMSDWLSVKENEGNPRRANHGECAQSCRWKYKVIEEKRPGEFIDLHEDERGTHLFNPRELALFSFIPELVKAGVTSFKIEGRMKTVHYLASVLSLYRRVLDEKPITEEEGLTELKRLKNSGFSKGFMKGSVGPDDYNYDNRTTVESAESVMWAVVPPTEEVPEGILSALDRPEIQALKAQHFDSSTVFTLANARENMQGGVTVECLAPHQPPAPFTLPDRFIKLSNEVANGKIKLNPEVLTHINNGAWFLIPVDLAPFSLMRVIRRN